MIDCDHCASLQKQIEAQELHMRAMARRLQQQFDVRQGGKTSEWVSLRFKLDDERDRRRKAEARLTELEKELSCE